MLAVMPCHSRHVKPGQDVTEAPQIVGYAGARLRSSKYMEDIFIFIHK